MKTTTIAAIATPVAPSGIGIVRVSGPATGWILTQVFRRFKTQKDRPKPAGDSLNEEGAFLSHRMYHGYIVDGTSPVDEVLLVLMRAPHSYTGEDVLEINAHGGPLVLQTILSLILKHGAEMAAPGEFTRRAYLNGRIDLTQAEAVADIIEARTQQAVSAAADQLSGGLSDRVGRIRTDLLAHLADLNADIEFGDSDDGVVNDYDLSRATAAIRDQALPRVRELVEQHDSTRFIRSGVRVALVGRPNSGKSTLLNQVLGRERAIVTSIPGTTRDVLEETVVLKGIPFVFFDTAGMGSPAADEVERLGMERARTVAGQADVVVFLIDVAAAPPFFREEELSELVLNKEKIVVAANKIDLIKEPLRQVPGLPDKGFPVVPVSALTGQGLPELKSLLADRFQAPGGEMLQGAVPSARHRASLSKAEEALLAALKAAAEGLPPELVALDLKAAVVALDEITGHVAGEEMLDLIFSRFCVGK